MHHSTRWARAHADEPEFQERKRAAYRRWYLKNREFQIARVVERQLAKKIAALEHEMEAYCDRPAEMVGTPDSVHHDTLACE